MNPKAHIDTIRRDVFWIDDIRGGLARLNPLSEKLKKAIEQLSEGLYSRDVHFILELIQNAEDNHYGANVDPSLSFRLTANDPTGTPGADGALIIENNELGFLFDNVDAICDVGRSTKTKQEGYIGEKGIGFKSVFQVSSNPHVLSHGYRFRLPETDPTTKLGYIVPVWVGSVPEGVQDSGTTIVLPLKPGRLRDLSRSLREIAPETILFLKKLRSLSIQIDDTYKCTVIKDAADTPLVKLLCEVECKDTVPACTEQLFWVRTVTFTRPENIVALKRDNIFERDVTIAIPLSADTKSKGELYAYLPVLTRSGLPFLVNADFLLTSSREGIKEDEPWNHWLRDCIAPTFVKAFCELLLNKEFRYQAYQYLPCQSDNDRADFFEEVANEVLLRLKGLPVIVLEHKEELAVPIQARRADARFRRLFSSSQPPAAICANQLVSSKIERFASQLEELGVPEVTDSEAVACLEDRSWNSKRSLDWFVDCFEYFKELKVSDSLKKEFQKAPIVPVEGGRLSCDAEQPIYLACSKDDRAFLKAVPALIKIPVAFLRPEFRALVEQRSNLVDWMCEVLSIYSFSQSNYCVDIANRLTSGDAMPDPDVIVAGTRFLARFCDDKVSIEDLPVVLTGGTCSLLSSLKTKNEIAHIVTPVNMIGGRGWQQMFEAGEDRSHLAVLASRYLRNTTVSVDHETLFRFLKRLGITDTPFPKKHETSYWNTTAQTPYERRCFQAGSDDRSSGSKLLRNTLSPSWLKTLAKGTIPESLSRRCNAVIAWIQRQSDSSATSRKEWAEARLDWSYYGRRHREFDSEFVNDLKSAAWLPTTAAGYVVPRAAFVKDETILAVLGNTVPYASNDLPSWALQLLGINTSATPRDLVTVLEAHSEEQATNAQLASKVYGLLAHLETDKNLKQVFREKSLIHLPNRSRRWLKSTEVVWTDRSETFGDQFGYLETTYPKLREFFVDELGVKSDVDAESFANRWLVLAESPPSEVRDIEGPMTQIFQALLPDCQRVRLGSGPPVWWAEFAERVLLWCRDKGFQSPRNCYVADDGELRRLFVKTNIPFAWRPEKASYASVEDIYRALGAKFLSESVSIECLNTSAGRQMSAPRYLTQAAKAQILAWAANALGEEQQERMVRDGLLDALSATQEERVHNLKVLFRLAGSSSIDSRLAYWDTKRRRLFVEDSDDDPEAVRQATAESIAKALMQNRQYRDVESLVFQVLCSDSGRARHFLSRRAWALSQEAKSLLGSAPSSGLKPNDEVNKEHPDIEVHQEEMEGTAANNLDYGNELESVFQRPATAQPTKGMERISPPPVPSPSHRREKVARDIEDERSHEPPRDQRIFEVLRQEWECPDPVIRQQLIEEYKGRCQICHEGFPKRDGEPFFISKYLVSRTKARTIDRLGNVLCLCPTCAAKFQHGAVEMDNPLEQVSQLRTTAEGGTGDLTVHFRLCGESCRITFSERHLIDLQELLKHLTVVLSS
jgi:hypothetical protein